MPTTQVFTPTCVIAQPDTLCSPGDRRHIILSVNGHSLITCTPAEAHGEILSAAHDSDNSRATCVYASTDCDQQLLLQALAGADLTNPVRLQLAKTILLPPGTHAHPPQKIAESLRAIFDEGLHTTLYITLRGISMRAIFGLLGFPRKVSETSQKADRKRAAEAITFFLSSISYNRLVSLCSNKETTVYNARFRELTDLLLGFIFQIDQVMYDAFPSKSIRKSALALYVLLQKVQERFWDLGITRLHPLVMATFKAEIVTASSDIQARLAAIIPVEDTPPAVLNSIASAVRRGYRGPRYIGDLATANPEFVRYILTLRPGSDHDTVALYLNDLVQGQFAQSSSDTPHSEGHLLLCHILSVLPKRFIQSRLKPHAILTSDLQCYFSTPLDRLKKVTSIARLRSRHYPPAWTVNCMRTLFHFARRAGLIFLRGEHDHPLNAAVNEHVVPFLPMTPSIASELNAKNVDEPSFISENENFLFVKLFDYEDYYAVICLCPLWHNGTNTITIRDPSTTLLISATLALDISLHIYHTKVSNDSDFPLEDIHSMKAHIKRVNEQKDEVPLILPLVVAMHLCTTPVALSMLLRQFIWALTTQQHLDNPDNADDCAIIQTLFTSGAPLSAIFTLFKGAFSIPKQPLFGTHLRPCDVDMQQQLEKTFAELPIASTPSFVAPFDCADTPPLALEYIGNHPNFFAFSWVDSTSRWAACAIKRLGSIKLVPHELICLIVRFALKAIIPEAQAVDPVYARALSYYDIIPTK